MQVSRALSQAFEAMEKRAADAIQGRNAQDLIDGVRDGIIAVYNPAGAGADAAAPAAGEGGDAEAADGQAEEGAAAAAAGEGDAADPVVTLKQELKALEAKAKQAAATKATSSGGWQPCRSGKHCVCLHCTVACLGVA
jgi:hypothetical protein